MKGLVSILAGIIIGALIAYFTLDYSGMTIQHMGDGGGEAIRTINELDVDLLLDSALIIIGISAFIYIIWSMIERGQHKREMQR
ncbi:hypothetical protein ACSVDE_07315 [Pseudalkalibacillus sp. Hm43]|uniref:hypothetical protein n=1 Tax=Pseudalkalibacillus sp. Hm43 TaxID=3450742 RepID=UPI003F423D72